ncbi:MAG: hypothetical protein KAX77_00820 [Xanthomonadales bacterium]|nr:hypothetical protein [Xanthomonadales bacterium]
MNAPVIRPQLGQQLGPVLDDQPVTPAQRPSMCQTYDLDPGGTRFGAEVVRRIPDLTLGRRFVGSSSAPGRILLERTPQRENVRRCSWSRHRRIS